MSTLVENISSFIYFILQNILTEINFPGIIYIYLNHMQIAQHRARSDVWLHHEFALINWIWIMFLGLKPNGNILIRKRTKTIFLNKLDLLQETIESRRWRWIRTTSRIFKVYEYRERSIKVQFVTTLFSLRVKDKTNWKWFTICHLKQTIDHFKYITLFFA